MKVYSSSLYNTAYGNDFEITSPKQHLVNNFQLYGTTYQNGTPTVTSPITPSSVTGRQTISIDVSNYPYNYNIDLSFVMNGIGNYRDRIYKDDTKWYFEKNIGTATLNEYVVYDSVTYSVGSSTTMFTFRNFLSYDSENVLPISTHLVGKDVRNDFTPGIFIINRDVIVRVPNSIININDPVGTFTTWLLNNNINIWYAYNKPITTEITDSTLISQLEVIHVEMGTNEISITPANAMPDISFVYFYTFDNNGYGFINDLLEAKVTEQINGDYYLEFKMPLNSKMAQYIEYNNIIKCNVGRDGEQLFRIKRIVKDFTTMSVYATHIFYDLLDNYLINVAPTNLYSYTYGQYLINRGTYPAPFYFSSNISKSASGKYVRKNLVEAIIGNIDNSMLAKFGGEIVRDNFVIRLNYHRGQDNHIKLLFGKNISSIEIITDIENLATRIIPVGFDGLTIPEIYVDSPLINNYPNPKMTVVEFSDIKYEPIVEGQEPSEDAYHDLNTAYQALRDRTNELYTNGIDKPQINIKIDWVELSKTNEYKDYSSLERVFIGDTIYARVLGTDYTTEVTKTVYNVLNDRVESFEIGTISASIVSAVNGNIQAIQNFSPSEILNNASNTAQQQIIEALGGTYGQIGGFRISSDKLWTEYYPPADFTQTDLTKVRNYLLDPVSNPLTDQEKVLYDLFGDGVVNAKDLLYMTKLIDLGITTTNPLKLEMNTGSSIMDTSFSIVDGNSNHIVDININGFYYENEKTSLDYYKSGDVYVETQELNVGGFVTSSTTKLMFTIPFNAVKDGTATITGGTFVIRGVSGYVNGNQASSTITPSTSGYTFTVDSYNESSVTISIKKSSAFTNTSNNTPVGIQIQGLEITFS